MKRRARLEGRCRQQ